MINVINQTPFHQVQLGTWFDTSLKYMCNGFYITHQSGKENHFRHDAWESGVIDSKFSIAFLPPSLPPPPFYTPLGCLHKRACPVPCSLLFFPCGEKGIGGTIEREKERKRWGGGGAKRKGEPLPTRCLGKWRVTNQTLTV